MHARGSIVIAALALAERAHAQNIVYSNLATSQEYIVAGGWWWDDATMVGGGQLQRMRLWAYNGQGGDARAFEGTIRFHLFNSAIGLPNGPVLGEFPFQNPTLINAGESLLIDSQDLTAFNIVLPADARLGVEFVFGTLFGAMYYGPPTVGASSDMVWMSVPPTPQPHASIVDSFGFELQTVPAPSGALLLAGGALVITRRRRT